MHAIRGLLRGVAGYDVPIIVPAAAGGHASALLLEGDMQSGTDVLKLEGDMQDGTTDVLLLEGDEV